jgi:MFS family permease
MWPYLQVFGASETFLAFVFAIYSVGELIGSVLWGYIYNWTSMKTSMITCVLTGLLGSITYASAIYIRNLLPLHD